MSDSYDDSDIKSTYCKKPYIGHWRNECGCINIEQSEMFDKIFEVIKEADEKIDRARIEAEETGQKLQYLWVNQVKRKALDKIKNIENGEEDEG